MDTALLLDYRGLDPNKCVETVLDPIVKRLSGFSRVQILTSGTSNVAYANQQEKDANWQRVVAAWANLNQRDAQVLGYDARGLSPSGPCEVWFKNMWMAFEDSDIDRIVYLPYDVYYMVAASDARRKRLQAFIDAINEGAIDLLMGTYEAATDIVEAREKGISNSFLIETTKAVEEWNANLGERRRTDIPKNYLEDFTLLELWSAFPQVMKWFSQQRTDAKRKPKPRTGFIGLSRGLWQEFIDRPYRCTMMPWAGTVQLLICAAVRTIEGNGSFSVAEQFVGDLEEPPMSFDDYRVAHQRERISFVIADERHYWSRQGH